MYTKSVVFILVLSSKTLNHASKRVNDNKRNVVRAQKAQSPTKIQFGSGLFDLCICYLLDQMKLNCLEQQRRQRQQQHFRYCNAFVFPMHSMVQPNNFTTDFCCCCCYCCVHWIQLKHETDALFLSQQLSPLPATIAIAWLRSPLSFCFQLLLLSFFLFGFTQKQNHNVLVCIRTYITIS